MIKNTKELKNLVHTSHNLILVIAISATIISIFYKEDIMMFLFPDTYTSSHSEILSILMLSFFAISLTYIYGTMITAAGKIKVLNKIVLVGVIINLILNLILIPQKGAYGAAIATVFTQYFVLLGQYIYGIKEFKIGFSFEIFLRRFIFIVLAGTVVYFTKNSLEYNWLIRILVSGLSIVTIAYVIGLIKISDLKK